MFWVLHAALRDRDCDRVAVAQAMDYHINECEKCRQWYQLLKGETE